MAARPWQRVTLLVVSLWTAILAGFLVWGGQVARQHTEELARHEAQVRFNKDVAFRNWVSDHGVGLDAGGTGATAYA